ncbi:15970_t:CDS:2 [Cetraspora pellucida]|uniref:15970_t:CDS:1 n=1 Tax=Cetraspora pellucida TaxID=1433469 RepID=A0A9N9N3P9_9GLOM|nr:15970_t:CDS:2 [Cetraspora pellucida]
MVEVMISHSGNRDLQVATRENDKSKSGETFIKSLTRMKTYAESPAIYLTVVEDTSTQDPGPAKHEQAREFFRQEKGLFTQDTKELEETSYEHQPTYEEVEVYQMDVDDSMDDKMSWNRYGNEDDPYDPGYDTTITLEKCMYLLKNILAEPKKEDPYNCLDENLQRPPRNEDRWTIEEAYMVDNYFEIEPEE